MNASSSKTVERILDFLALQPGASTQAIGRAVGISPSSAEYHLHRLERAGRVSRQRGGGKVANFLRAHGLSPMQRRLLLLSPEQRAVFDALLETERPVTATSAALSTGLPIVAARWAFHVLVLHGLARRSKHGRVALVEEARAAVSATMTPRARVGAGVA
jgi:DNA-binding transcriptional ArsR family regulator